MEGSRKRKWWCVWWSNMTGGKYMRRTLSSTCTTLLTDLIQGEWDHTLKESSVLFFSKHSNAFMKDQFLSYKSCTTITNRILKGVMIGRSLGEEIEYELTNL